MTETKAPRAIAIAGPTASGKTRRAVAVARSFGGEIVSCDSRQVYRGMDLGTGKDVGEYGDDVRVHLLDVCEAGERYNLFRFLADASSALEDIERRGRRAVLCGGSGMYLENLLAGVRLPRVPRNDALRARLEGVSPEGLAEILAGYKSLHNTTDTDTRQRALRAIEIEEWYLDHPEEARSAKREEAVPMEALVIGIDIPREERRRRIDRRLEERLQQGMIEEVKGLAERGVSHGTLEYYGLEYKYISLHLQGVLTLDEMIEKLRTAIHQFAKRQMTWLRGMERRGIAVRWLPYDMDDEAFEAEIRRLL